MPPRSASALSMVAQPQQVGRTQPLHPKLKRRAATESKQPKWGVSQPRRRRGRDKASADSKPSSSAGPAGLRIHGARKPCFASQEREMQRLARSKEQQPPAPSGPKHIVHTALLSPNINLRKKPPLSERGAGAPRVVRGRFQPLRSLAREPPRPRPSLKCSCRERRRRGAIRAGRRDQELGPAGSPPPVGQAENGRSCPHRRRLPSSVSRGVPRANGTPLMWQSRKPLPRVVTVTVLPYGSYQEPPVVPRERAPRRPPVAKLGSHWLH